MSKVALFGGSFNPVHNAHLEVANQTLTKLNLDEVWFLPSLYHPFKGEIDQVSIYDRLHMLELALNGHEHLLLKTTEIEQQLSYTIDTITYLEQNYSDHDFYLLIGEDNANEFEKWHRFQDIEKLVKIVVFNRSEGRHISNDRFIYLDLPFMDISSTKIRNRLLNGDDVKLMLPESVFNYIQEKELYR